jgi:ParB-like chromosome segregation protein Spo0J
MRRKPQIQDNVRFSETASLPFNALRISPNNARTHSKRQVEQIVRSIERFGFTNPVLIDSSSQIFAEHGRAAAAR